MRHAGPENASFHPSCNLAYNSRRYEMKPRRAHQYCAPAWPHSSSMSDNIISPNDAELVIHRLVTERIPVVAWFVSADKSVRAKITGFVTSSTRNDGLHIASEVLPVGGPPTPSFMIFTGIAGSVSEYADDTQVPSELPLGSGLRLTMPNGDTLVILEIRSNKS